MQISQKNGQKISAKISGNAIRSIKESTSSPWDVGFTYLRSWLHLFKTLNPNSVIDLGTSTLQTGKEIFESLFFMSGSQAARAALCKPLCGLDGAHFKTALWNGYIFIVACTKDGNNRDVLIALFICNVENTANMARIISNMKSDAGVKAWLEQDNFIFPVDRAACIKAAIYLECPKALVRDCGKHAERNVGITPVDKKAYWEYITAKTLSKQTAAMESLISSNPTAATKLQGIDKKLICSLDFPGYGYNEITNNISERGVKNITVKNRKLAPVAMLKAVMAENMRVCNLRRVEDQEYLTASPDEMLCKYAKLIFDVSKSRLFLPFFAFFF